MDLINYIPPPNFRKPITLYKVHGDPNCDKLLNLSRYLFSEKIDTRPLSVVEREFPAFVTNLPTIVFINGYRVSGYKEIVKHYERMLSIDDLENKSEKFTKNNPDYRITDNNTHKHLVNN